MRGFLIKLAVGVAGLVLLVKYGSIDLGVLAKAADRPGLLLLAFACILATVPIAAWRWWLLLRGLNFTLTLAWSINATFISLFFHTFLPGAHGGDLVRLALAYRSVGGSLSHLTFSLLVDRLSGLVALLLLGVLMLPGLPSAYATQLEWAVATFFVVGAAGLIIAVKSGDCSVNLVGRLPKPVGPALARIAKELLTALRAYWSQPGRLFAALVVSVVQYILILLALFSLGHAMGFTQLSWIGYGIAGAWSTIANSLPLTPGGIGVGEAAFARVAVALTHPTADVSYGTVFLAMRVLTVIIGIVGILPWLLNRTDLRSGIDAIKSKPSESRSLPVTE